MNIVTLAVSFIFAAFGLYTIAVWSERFAGRLEFWHLGVFWLGFAADTVGTSAMYEIAQTMRIERSAAMLIHGGTGLLALVLMLVHCSWATIVLLRKNEKAILRFHEFSLAVWCVWLIPFLLGGAMEATRGMH